MTDKPVTHEDLSVLRGLRDRLTPEDDYERDLLDRLIAAAEADAPPLPEGWVLLRFADGAQRVLWHHNGLLSVVYPTRRPLSTDYFGTVEGRRERLTPLRPTVTEADVEKASQVLRRRGMVDYRSGEVARELLTAAGVEVQS